MYFVPVIGEDEQIAFAKELKEKLSGDVICFLPYSKANEFISKYSLEGTLQIIYRGRLREHVGRKKV